MIKSTLLFGSVVIALSGLAACSHDQKPAEHSGVPAASAPARELSGAVSDLADARCDLEQRCNNIGAGESFDNREACDTKMHGALGDELNTKDCPNGVDDSKLSACLSEIQAHECGNPIDSMSEWAACRQGELCLND